MNRWKIAFWVSFVLLLTVTVIGMYSIIDQAVTLTYIKEGYSETESDLETLRELINETDLSKQEVTLKLKEHRLFEFMDFSRDTIEIEKGAAFFQERKTM